MVDCCVRQCDVVWRIVSLWRAAGRGWKLRRQMRLRLICRMVPSLVWKRCWSCHCLCLNFVFRPRRERLLHSWTLGQAVKTCMVGVAHYCCENIRTEESFVVTHGPRHLGEDVYEHGCVVGAMIAAWVV